jgi:hypothetical protein
MPSVAKKQETQPPANHASDRTGYHGTEEPRSCNECDRDAHYSASDEHGHRKARDKKSPARNKHFLGE